MAIEGSVEEAKALYKPPEDSQGELGVLQLQADELGGEAGGFWGGNGTVPGVCTAGPLCPQVLLPERCSQPVGVTPGAGGTFLCVCILLGPFFWGDSAVWWGCCLGEGAGGPAGFGEAAEPWTVPTYAPLVVQMTKVIRTRRRSRPR